MRPYFFGILLLICPAKGFSTLVGNPAQPSLQTTGIIQEMPAWWSFRISYFGDYVYKQRFHDEFQIDGCTSSASRLKLWTQAGMLTFNVKDRLDLYGIFGGQRLQIDEEVLTKQQFAWGVGGKIVFYHAGRLRAGCDIKYFQSDQTPRFFQCEDFAYNIVNDFRYNYNEFQTALGLSYRTKYCSPYANASYLIAKLKPSAADVRVRLPMMNMNVDVGTKSITTTNRFGLALGATIIDHRKATLAIEWRTFNQNSIDVSGELRF